MMITAGEAEEFESGNKDAGGEPAGFEFLIGNQVIDAPQGDAEPWQHPCVNTEVVQSCPPCVYPRALHCKCEQYQNDPGSELDSESHGVRSSELFGLERWPST
jgi:hypothetical protein